MVFVLLRSGECVDVEAVAAGLRQDRIVCTDAYGQEVATFAASDVEVFTRSEREARALQSAIRTDHPDISTQPNASSA